MPDISVIVPIYNAEQYLRETLDSIISQHEPELEIILVNDGSSDNCLAICQEYAAKDTRIVIIDQENGGVSRARNAALDIATGKYICYLDSDDSLVPTILQKGYEVCESLNLDLLACSFMNYHESEETEDLFSYEIVDKSIRRHEYKTEVMTGPRLANTLIENKDYYVTPCSNLVRRELLEKHHIRFYEGIIFEDAPYTMQLYMYSNRAAIINDIFTLRRIRYGSIEHSPRTPHRLFSFIRGYTYMTEIINVAMEDNNLVKDDEFIRFVYRELRRRYLAAEKNYRLLSPSEREEALQKLTLIERINFEGSVVPYHEYRAKTTEQIRSLKNDLNKKTLRVSDLKDKLLQSRADVKSLKATNKKLDAEIKRIRGSKSFRIGKALTSPARAFRKSK